MSRRRSSIAGVPTLTPPMRVGADRFVRQHTLEHAPWLADDRAVTPCAPDQRHGRPADITLKFLRTRLGRVIRDINREIDGHPELEARFGRLLDLALMVRHQDHRQRGTKVYSLHAPEVECIGKGKARAPYEFGCKVSVATPVTRPKGGQFVLHAKALHGNPFDGHTLGPVIADH